MPRGRAEQFAEPVRIVRVVHPDAHTTDIEPLKAPRVVGVVAAEAAQRRVDRDLVHAECAREVRRPDRIGHVVPSRPAERERHLLHRRHRIARCEGTEPSDAASVRLGGDAQGDVVAIEHERAVGAERARHDQLGLGEIGQRLDPVATEVILSDVRDDRRGRMRYDEAAPEQSASGGLEYGGRHARVAEHEARAGRSAPVTAPYLLAADEHTVAAAVTHHVAGAREHLRDDPHGGGLAVASGDERDRDRAECGPVDRDRGGQVAGRPGAAPCAVAKRDALVVEQERHAALGRFVSQRDQRRIRLGGDELTQPRDRGGFVGGESFLGGIHGGQCARLAVGGGARPGPLVRECGRHEGIDRCRECERGAIAAATQSTGGAPAKCRRDALCAQSPRRQLVHGAVGIERRVEHDARCVEPETRAEEPARVLPRWSDGRGDRVRGQSSLSLARRTPRSSRTSVAMS